jgi:hypothetical protein
MRPDEQALHNHQPRGSEDEDCERLEAGAARRMLPPRRA